MNGDPSSKEQQDSAEVNIFDTDPPLPHEDPMLRLLFIEKLYDETDGSPFTWVGPEVIALRLGIDDAYSGDLIAEYLERAKLVEKKDWEYPNEIRLTEAGIREVEQARRAPGKPTEHFPPPISVDIGGDAYGLQIGTVGSTQGNAINIIGQRAEMELFLAELRSVIDQLPLADGQLATVQADLETAEAQLRSPQPRAAIVRESVRALRDIVLSVAGSGAYAGLAGLAQRLHF